MAAGGVITTGNHPKMLWPGLKAIWGQVYAEHPPEFGDLYDQEESSQAYEQLLGMTGFGLAPVKPEGQPGAIDSELQGGVTTAVHIAYALGWHVTYEEMQDNLYLQVGARRARANAFSMNQTIENVAAFLYNNAFSTTYFTLWDGVAMASASHVNVTGGTFSNILSPAAALSEAALEDMTIQIMLAGNDRGLKISLMPQSLHVSPYEWYNANRILKSVMQPDTMSNNINVLRATNALPGGVKLNHYFTSNRAWFVRTNVPEAGLKMFWRERPNLDQDNDHMTKNAQALSYMRFSVTCGDARALFASNAS